jgi:DNA-binding response OmpR family regulator
MQDLSSLTVLVVDDDKPLRGLMLNMLRRMGTKAVVEAENGEHGLQLFRVSPTAFDLILCDWEMPVMSGMEFCKQIRSEHSNLPFLMVTGRSDLNSVIAAKEGGVSSYIAKPFSLKELNDKITFLMRARA